MSDPLKPKIIKYDDDMLDELEEGVKAVHDAVGRTMGPAGQLVLYEENIENPYPTVTKDGVSVASMISFKDQTKNIGAQFVIQAARKQVYESGDGTTLTSILTYKIFKEGRKAITYHDHNEVISGIRKAVGEAVDIIKEQSIDKVSIDDLKNIARISINEDTELASKIAEAVDCTGKYGMVFQERSPSDVHSVEYQDGYQLNIGILDRAFANKGNLMSLHNPYILVTDQNIVDATKILPILKKIKESLAEEKKPELVIIAPLIGSELFQIMKRNITDEKKGQFFMVHIKPSKNLKPEASRMVMEDIAAITGATFISQDSGYQIDKLELDQLGSCGKITSYPEKTLISGYKGDVEKRIEILTGNKELIEDNYTKELIDESLARLIGGIATIKVGGRNLTEQTEILFRVDDAVRACKSAQEMGFVRGGGVAMLLASSLLLDHKTLVGEVIKPGENVIFEALKYPAQKILQNARRDDWQNIISNVISAKLNSTNGYNIKDKDHNEDMFELGIIDPTKVIIHALKNAASAAISMLQSSVMIIEDEEE